MPNTVNRPDTIGPSQLRALMADPSLRILDVRTGGEFESVHIPGSINIPLPTLTEHVDEVADLDHPVVLVCRSGARATAAGTHLSAAGKQLLHVLEGGIDSWEAAGGDVVRSTSTRWAMDRQVRLVAGALALVAVVSSLAVPWLKWGAALIGAGLTFSAVTNTCAMAGLLGRLPYNRGPVCELDKVLAQLRSATIDLTTGAAPASGEAQRS